jgi:hypothetical protein
MMCDEVRFLSVDRLASVRDLNSLLIDDTQINLALHVKPRKQTAVTDTEH